MLVRRLRSLAPAIALLALPLTSVPALADQEVTVRMVDFRFEPSSLNVRAGEKVRFTLVNAGERPHDLHVEGPGVAADAVEGAGNVAPGQSTTWEYTFASAGSYQIWCPVGNHRDQGMIGTLSVAGAQAGQPGQLPRTGDAAFPFSGLVFAAGALLLGVGWKLRRTRQGVGRLV